jgi:probable F420-dependent oxidoreductase
VNDVTFGLCLPNFRIGASREGIDAALETAERLGWESVWTTDHILPDSSARAKDYWSIFDAVATLAYAAARTNRVRLGTSVLVVPMRNAVEQAKTLASVDALSDGRLMVGVGIGWSEIEYANAGLADRFRVRGAYLDEAIRVWRHLWSGSKEPFNGRFQSFEEFNFEPLPAQGAAVPVLVGGRADAALRRAGQLGDGYQATSTSPAQYVERAAAVRAAAEEAGRPEPHLSVRVQVFFDETPHGFYALAGTPQQMAADIEAFHQAGAGHVLVDLREVEPERTVRAMERFDREIVQRFRSPERGART